jgi:hypothetical protein
MTKHRFLNSLNKYDNSVSKNQLVLEASLGIILNGIAVVDVPDRNQFVYARLRDNQSEVIQAFNDQVSSSYDLPVLLMRQKTRYVVIGRDTLRYGDWGNQNLFLPLHGWTHSFDDAGKGNDVAFVYEKQTMPGLLSPWGNPGVGQAFLNRYVLQKNDGSYIYVGNTGTIDLTQYDPVAPNTSVMVLVSIDSLTGNPHYTIGSGSYFSSSLTGTANIIQHVPPNPNPNRYIGISAVRLTNQTSIVQWSNIYDVRQFISPMVSGSTGGGGSTILSGTFMGSEDVSSQFDGTNTAFTITGTIQTNTEKIYYNGLRQERGTHYTIGATGRVINTLFTGTYGDVMQVDYGNIGAQNPIGNISLSTPIPYSAGAYPRSGSFTSNGGILVFFVSATMYLLGTGIGQIDVKLDGAVIGSLKMYFNSASFHLSLPSNNIIANGISVGSHTVELVVNSGTSDANDVSQVLVMEK